jgi:hypothetical protein
MTLKSKNRRRYKKGRNKILDRERMLGIENIFMLYS